MMLRARRGGRGERAASPWPLRRRCEAAGFTTRRCEATGFTTRRREATGLTTRRCEVAGLSSRRRQVAGFTSRGREGFAGFTLIEVVIVVAIVGILAAAVLPLARWSVKRQNEYALQERLRILRGAIDRYHDMAVAGLIESDQRTGGWPPDLETLVEGVELRGQPPPVMPAVSDRYTATGPGLVGGFTGETGGTGAPGAGGTSGTRAGAITVSPDGSSIRVEGNVALRLGEGGGLSLDGGSLLERSGGERTMEVPLVTDRPGRDRDRAPARGPDGQPIRIVFLRRIPVDPMTGEADWGLRCYGEEPGDDLWCGRNVFDVHSKSRAQGIDGRPYREW